MFFFFLFNDTATTEIYTLSLHDALPISRVHAGERLGEWPVDGARQRPQPRWRDRHGRTLAARRGGAGDRKSTRLNSSHANISYAVFCLKKKKKKKVCLHLIYNVQLTK